MSKNNKPSTNGSARSVALDAIMRIEKGGAYANILLPQILSKSKLEDADRKFVTELVYGSTRMKRACDYIADEFISKKNRNHLESRVRAAIRLGVYQLIYLKTPAHAAVSETVDLLDHRAKGLVNAVLRKVADSEVEFPDLATELSYPDWIVEKFNSDWGVEGFGKDPPLYE